MVRQIPSSLSDAINEEPERFAAYLDIPRISSAKNPYQEFLRQFQKAFNSSQGLNLFQYIVNRYKLLNTLYKSEDFQKRLPDDFKGSLKRNETKQFFIKYQEQVKKKQKIREVKIKKPISVSSHLRSGKTIPTYKSTKKHVYTERQKRFIISRKKFPLQQLTSEFNTAFGTSITFFGIRDKRLRLFGRKK